MVLSLSPAGLYPARTRAVAAVGPAWDTESTWGLPIVSKKGDFRWRRRRLRNLLLIVAVTVGPVRLLSSQRLASFDPCHVWDERLPDVSSGHT
jgi:hypothetical protein